MVLLIFGRETWDAIDCKDVAIFCLDLVLFEGETILVADLLEGELHIATVSVGLRDLVELVSTPEHGLIKRSRMGVLCGLLENPVIMGSD